MLYILIILFVILFIWSKSQCNYWIQRGVKHDPPVPLFGNHVSVIFGRKTDIEKYTELYKKYTEERYVGYYKGRVPYLIIRDPELLKHIFTLDFANFHSRGFEIDPKVEPLMLNVLFSKGDRWKLLRNELSPAFSISKIRSMFPLILQCAEKLRSTAEEFEQNGRVIDVCDLMARFFIDITGACIFGIEMNAINTEKSLFVKLGHIIFTKSKWQMLLFALRDLFPEATLLQKIPIGNNDIERYILKIVNIIREHREEETYLKRNDFMDLIFELELRGKVYGNSLKEKDEKGLPKQVEFAFDEMYVAAQLFIMFSAGFETSSTATSFTLHQLAYHPDIQCKIQEEIDNTLKKHNDKLCFDAVSEMSLLQMAFKESMRIFPPAGMVIRVCEEEYKLPGTDITLEPGTKIVIPVQGIHMNAKYYDNPTEFRPERFSPENIKNRQKYVYIPFGEGPRKCLGGRLALYESLVALVAILEKFSVEPAPTSHQQHRVKRTSYLVQCTESLPLILKRRNK